VFIAIKASTSRLVPRNFGNKSIGLAHFEQSGDPFVAKIMEPEINHIDLVAVTSEGSADRPAGQSQLASGLG